MHPHASLKCRCVRDSRRRRSRACRCVEARLLELLSSMDRSWADKPTGRVLADKGHRWKISPVIRDSDGGRGFRSFPTMRVGWPK